MPGTLRLVVDKIEMEMSKALCMYDLLTGSCNQLLVIVFLVEGLYKGMNMNEIWFLKGGCTAGGEWSTALNIYQDVTCATGTVWDTGWVLKSRNLSRGWSEKQYGGTQKAGSQKAHVGTIQGRGFVNPENATEFPQGEQYWTGGEEVTQEINIWALCGRWVRLLSNLKVG